jgi:regulator of protease activity HflC (stomatin/prohibitin superfamily)
MSVKKIVGVCLAGFLGLFVLIGGCCSMKSVPVGQVSVATLFGKVQDVYDEGMHFPVNPLLSWTTFDAREKTVKEAIGIPTEDQQITIVDVSVNYRVKKALATKILTETGNEEQLVAVHLIPNLRSLARENGKSIKKCEDFYLDTTQKLIQDSLLIGLQKRLDSKGLDVTSVLIRDMKLPDYITKAIEAKKVRSQEVETQKAELERYRSAQEQVVVKAEAEKKSAEADASRKRTMADAQAYEIEKINKAIAGSPAFIQLEALKALQSMSKDPAAKIYFLDGSSPNPLPLIHMGEVPAK